MEGRDRMLYIGAVSLLVRLHASMGSSVESALDKRRSFDMDGDPLVRLAADFNAQGFGLVMEENGETWALVDRPEPAAAPLPVEGEPEAPEVESLLDAMRRQAAEICTCDPQPKSEDILSILDHMVGCDYRNERTRRNDPPASSAVLAARRVK